MTEGNKKVEGYLLSFRDRDILRDLDRLENYREHRSLELNDYSRRSVTVWDFSDRYLGIAWCYFMTAEKIKKFQSKIVVGNNWHSRF